MAATDTAELRDDLHERLQAALGDAYVLGRELGGGMSRVFVAEDARLGRRVAVKVLRPDLAAGLSAHRFAREVRLAARLQHPHVVPLLAAGEVDGLPYYTMPFVGGESLRAQLQRDGALPVPAAVRLVRELADALAHAHAEGVVHRDLKPENVLLSGGHAVVTDFGVAKALASATQGGVVAGAAAPPAASTASSTAFGIAVGTPAYMAPEQVAADPATDHRADLYALGLIAYEVLAGAHPFADRPPHAVLAAQLTEVPPPLASRHPDVPPALAAFIARLLAKRPEDRPQTAQEVVRTMERFASAAGGLTPPPAGRGRASRRAAAAVLVAGLVLAGVGTLARTRRGAPDRPASGGVAHAGAPLVERRVAVAPFTNQTGDTTLALLGGLTADWIAQGLGAAGFPDVVDPGTVRTTWQTAADVRGLARATGARLVVSGAYYVEGDSVRLLARVVDAADDRVLRALEPVSAPASAPRPALAVLRERVLGAVAALLDIGPDAWAVPTGLPPSLAAYRHAAAGNEHFGRYELREAAREYEAAYRLDSSYVQPLLTAGITQHLLGARATADSLFRMAARSRDHLAPADRYLLDALWAEVRGDLAGALRGSRELARVAPNSLGPHLVGWHAPRVNRPAEGVAALARVPPERMTANYWEALTLAQHVLGDYRAELGAAEQGRRQFPDRLTSLYNEARALAALGQVTEVERRLGEIVNLPAEPLFQPVEVLTAIAGELRAHGHPAAAEAAFARALRWYADHPATVRTTPPFRAVYAEALYAAGRWDEARRLFEALAALPSGALRPPARAGYLGVLGGVAPDALDCRGYLGVLAARRGDRAAALAADSVLAAPSRPNLDPNLDPYADGRPTYWRARIAATLGDRERAVTLLREALQAGLMYPALHGQPDLAPLHDLPAFRELIRPKG